MEFVSDRTSSCHIRVISIVKKKKRKSTRKSWPLSTQRKTIERLIFFQTRNLFWFLIIFLLDFCMFEQIHLCTSNIDFGFDENRSIFRLNSTVSLLTNKLLQEKSFFIKLVDINKSIYYNEDII